MQPVYNNELYHYGKKGMKWGRRIKRNLDATNRMVKDQFRHPIHSTKAQLDLLKRNPKKALFMTTDTMEKLNIDVKKRVVKSKTPDSIKSRKEGFERAHKTLRNIGHFAVRMRQNYETQKLANEIFR